MITYGTNPGMGIPLTARVPDPADLADTSQKNALIKALKYMDLTPGRSLLGHPVNVVFIGSCTNARHTPAKFGRPGTSPKRTDSNAPAHVKQKCAPSRLHSWIFFQQNRTKFFLRMFWMYS